MNLGNGIDLQSVVSSSLAQSASTRAESMGRREDVDTAAREFERLLSTMLVKQMRSTLKDGFFPSGPGNDAYNGWFDEAIGNSLADSGTMGLLGQLKAQLGGVSDALNAEATVVQEAGDAIPLDRKTNDTETQ